MENVHVIPNFLLPEELEIIEQILSKTSHLEDKPEQMDDRNLGRILYDPSLPYEMLEAIQARVELLVGQKLERANCLFTDYSAKYGQPNLPPHFDGDQNAVIVDYQYKSNTSWGLGVNSTIYEMEDNKAIIFNPNEYPHWRPHKTFQEGEYITMIFFRFPSDDIDYSHMRLSQDDPIFEEARKVRDS